MFFLIRQEAEAALANLKEEDKKRLSVHYFYSFSFEKLIYVIAKKEAMLSV
jgi:hypothetical protein